METIKKLSHKQVSALGGSATAKKYPKELRSTWARKAAKARWAKVKRTNETRTTHD